MSLLFASPVIILLTKNKNKHNNENGKLGSCKQRCREFVLLILATALLRLNYVTLEVNGTQQPENENTAVTERSIVYASLQTVNEA